MWTERPAPREAPTQHRNLWWAIPLGCDDETAYWSLTPHHGLFRREQIRWLSQGWLPVATFRYEFTYLAPRGGWGDKFRFGASNAAIEMLEGYAIGVPPSPAEMIQVPAAWINLRPRYGVDELAEMIVRARQRSVSPYGWNRPQWDRRPDLTLHRFNVPAGVGNLKIIGTGTFLMPIYTALIAAADGNRIAVVEGITGRLDHHLSAHFTWHAPSLVDHLYDGRPVEV
ncbi:MAG: hypothetical protein FWC87_07565 [Acidimicrobiaceae bacterium]|nr:hypothetical protein [Acidimicrobiaceae bacterium]